MTIPTPVAEYVRMSTEHQRYSITYQQAANASYADAHGLDIIRSYVDAGISGLTLHGRDGLQAMLADVLGGTAPYKAILVYDVSRWGRFQDPDEGAHYEFICREAGVQVRYSAEPFENDGALSSVLLKNLKRIMAAEYSRELSAKVVRAKSGWRDAGFWQGGVPSYGYRRQIVNADGSPGMVLERSQQKSLQGCRSILVRGPQHELDVVRWIFESCIEGASTREIAERLNDHDVPTEKRAKWSRQSVRAILNDRKCIGEMVVGRRAKRLSRSVSLAKGEWLTIPASDLRIIDQSTFVAAHRILHSTKPWASDEALEQSLRDMLAKHGKLSSTILDADPEAYCSAVYAKRFGGMLGAYARVGYAPTSKQLRCAERVKIHQPYAFRMQREWPTDEALISGAVRLLQRAGRLTSELIDMATDLPSAAYYRYRFGSLANVFALAGYTPTKQQRLMLVVNRRGRPAPPKHYFSWAAPTGDAREH
jgi:DNA invertase Pin-like site-specific DNA recombinase